MDPNPILPPELITEILYRLPVKPLLKFKCVSKSWLALISSPNFIKTHTKLSANNKNYTHHTLLSPQRLTQETTTRYSLMGCYVNSFFSGSVTQSFNSEYPIQFNSWISVAGSAHGLICISCGFADFIIWNPLIRSSKRVPVDCQLSTKTYSWYNYSFGYDEFNDDYKLVTLVDIVKEEDVGYIEGRIYSLKSNSWSNLDDLGERMPFYNTGGFMANGKLHWDCFVDDIISLGLADAEWGTVETPPREEHDTSLCMGVLGGDLAMVFANDTSSYNSIWVMKEYGVRESWTKMYTVKHLESCVLSPPFVRSSEGEILFVDESGVMIYNPVDESIRYPEIVNRFDRFAKYIYLESLVCPNLLSRQIAQQE